MDTVVLGRTGLVVSAAGLGCGGPSRLGQRTGATERESIRLVQRALEFGVTYFDTAQAYGTEEIVARGLAGHRDAVVIATKIEPWPSRSGRPLDAVELRAAVGRSLARLRCDAVDVLHLHGVRPEQYDYCLGVLVPELERLRDDGLIGHLAVSESFQTDPGHAMLQRAVADDCWEVVMVGFNPLNQSARERVLPLTTAKGIGVEVMMAVRGTFSRPDELRRIVSQLVEEGHVPSEHLDLGDPFGFLVQAGAAHSVIDAAYRFARHEPGAQVVLVGTGDRQHLEENIRSINREPLPAATLSQLELLFGGIDHFSAR